MEVDIVFNLYGGCSGRDWNMMCSDEFDSFFLRFASCFVFALAGAFLLIHGIWYVAIVFFLAPFLICLSFRHRCTCCLTGRKQEETSASATVGSPSRYDESTIIRIVTVSDHSGTDNSLRRVPSRWSGRQGVYIGGRQTSDAGEEHLSTGASQQSTGDRGRHSSSAGDDWLVLRVELPPPNSSAAAAHSVTIRLGPDSSPVDPGQDQVEVCNPEQDPPPTYQQAVEKASGACASAAGVKEELPPPSYDSATRKGPLRSRPKLQICNNTGDWMHPEGNSQSR